MSNSSKKSRKKTSNKKSSKNNFLSGNPILSSKQSNTEGQGDFLRNSIAYGDEVAREVAGQEIVKSDTQIKSSIRQWQKNKSPEEIVEHAFENIKIFAANDRIWKILGFDDVPKNFDGLEERAGRFALLFYVMDWNVAQSQAVLKELANSKYNEIVAEYLINPTENPAKYIADCIETFNISPIKINPPVIYNETIGWDANNYSLTEEDFNKSQRSTNFCKCTDKLRNFIFSQYNFCVGENLPLSHESINIFFDSAYSFIDLLIESRYGMR